MIFSCEADGSDFEVLAHNFRNNYEVAIDAFGDLWQSDNDDDGNRSVRINHVLRYGNYGYLEERTRAGWRSPRLGMHADIPKRHWHQNDPGVVPNLLITGAGSPTGILVYEGSLLPPAFRGQMIHADAGPNVVRAYPVIPKGASYEARIVDLVRSKRDRWFRPADVCAAPDGSLFVADWYDPGVGGHGMGDVTRGRIYRIAPPGHPYRVPEVDWTNAEACVRALSSGNQAMRIKARRALLAFQGTQEGQKSALLLKARFEDRLEHAATRARALWVLAEGEDRMESLLLAARDPDPRLRVVAVRATATKAPEYLLAIARMLASDPENAVRRACAIALHGKDGDTASEIWARLARNHQAGDRTSLEALGIGAEGHWPARMRVFEEMQDGVSEDVLLELAWRSRAPSSLKRIAEAVLTAGPDERPRLLRSLAFHQRDAARETALTLLENPAMAQDAALLLPYLEPELAQSSRRLRRMLHLVLENVRGTRTHIDLVMHFRLKDEAQSLTRIVLSDTAEPVRGNAASALLQLGLERDLTASFESLEPERATRLLHVIGTLKSRTAHEFLANFLASTARLRELRLHALEALCQSPQGALLLLDRIESGDLPEDLRFRASEILSRMRQRAVVRRAEEVLQVPRVKSGAKLPPRSELLAMKGDAERGQKVFARSCAECHVVGTAGIRFGPELSQIGSKLAREALLETILDPSAAISFGFEGVRIDTENGDVLTGYVESETKRSVTLRMAGGITKKVRVRSIDERTKLEASLMPADLQKDMTAQEIADLLEYLSELK